MSLSADSRPRSFKTKLVHAIMLTNLLALTGAGLGFVGYEWLRIAEETRGDLSAAARRSPSRLAR